MARTSSSSSSSSSPPATPPSSNPPTPPSLTPPFLSPLPPSQESTAIPTFARFAFVAHPPTPLPTHLPYLAAPPFAALASALAGLLRCSSSARVGAEAARQAVLDGAGPGSALLRPVGEGDEDEEGFAGAERWEGRTLGEWLAPFL